MTIRGLVTNSRARTGWCHYIHAKSTKDDRAHFFNVNKAVGKALCGIVLPLRLIHLPLFPLLAGQYELCGNCMKKKFKRRKHHA